MPEIAKAHDGQAEPTQLHSEDLSLPRRIWRAAIWVGEHEVVVDPVLANQSATLILVMLVHLERGDCSLTEVTGPA
jgi:hypothetical protein